MDEVLVTASGTWIFRVASLTFQNFWTHEWFPLDVIYAKKLDYFHQIPLSAIILYRMALEVSVRGNHKLALKHHICCLLRYE